MQISKITKLKNGLYEIIVSNNNQDHQFKFAEDVIIKHNLYHNKTLNEEDFSLLNSLTNYSKNYTSALNYISYKMRSENEVRNYLIDKNADPLHINEIIDKLKKLNYINDQNYSDAFVKYQFEMNKKGPILITEELMNKKINKEMILNSLQMVTEEMVIKNITNLIKYYDKLNKRKSSRKLKESILKYLIVKGYDYELITRELNNYPFSENNNDDDLLKKELIKVYHKLEKKYQDFELKSKVIKTLLNKGFNYEDIQDNLNLLNMEG